MRLLSPPCGDVLLGRPGVLLLSLLAFVLPGHGCPDKCLCSSQTVKCQNQELAGIPEPLPLNTKILFVTGNRIPRIGEASFPSLLEQLTDLYLSGNEMEHVDAMAFENLPNLQRLDLSNNRLLTLSESAFPEDNKVQLLNLSRSFPGQFLTDTVQNFLQNSSLQQLTTLDLSNNYLVTLPGDAFAGLSSLATLSLQNSSLVTVQNGTLKLPPLRDLDLRDNSLKDLPASTLADIGLQPDLRLWLAGNPWRCDCVLDNMLAWLKNSTQVMDVQNLTCSDPEPLRQQPLLQLEVSQLKCSSNMEGVLETSYVFLGLVLALIGVIFLLVLYLNRKGIKRWIYNIRDACRDHMEGYHYRYEINSDPRLANLSINSDV
ncbi:trophoblast glycoprotein b [Cololabis saira]|uniref:trophoblast glycoprotein b n=1 Tax=Cololabis saira TaxID=129043 RepID=UPI002AD3E4E7|nr:trophoblast glycoprotein b [Cololabis saira]